jgi:hypothetical protein
MAPSAKDQILDFIDEMLDGVFDDLPVPGTTPCIFLYQTSEMRLDVQGFTSAKKDQPLRFNLQIQVNNECENRSLKKLASKTVAMVLPLYKEECNFECSLQSFMDVHP